MGMNLTEKEQFHQTALFISHMLVVARVVYLQLVTEQIMMEAEAKVKLAQSVKKRELNAHQKINVLAASGLMAAVSLEIV